MPHRMAGSVVLLLTLLPGVVAPAGAAQAAPDVEKAARTLVPLLKGVRERLQPRVTVQPGTLPPSPFTGQQSTVAAVQVGKTEVQVDEGVRQALDRLLAWNRQLEPETADATLFVYWLDRVRVKAASVRPPGSTSIECDTACAIERFTKPGEAFGDTRKSREDMRDQLLLEALIDAVKELEP